jgi:hypothetical protein
LRYDLVPLWRSQLQHLWLGYHKWKNKHGGDCVGHRVWRLPVFMLSRLPDLLRSVVRAMCISWTKVNLVIQYTQWSEPCALAGLEVVLYCYGSDWPMSFKILVVRAQRVTIVKCGTWVCQSLIGKWTYSNEFFFAKGVSVASSRLGGYTCPHPCVINVV